jgi:hypothetical protein
MYKDDIFVQPRELTTCLTSPWPFAIGETQRQVKHRLNGWYT